MIKITLPNGLTVEGTPEQVNQVATGLGFGYGSVVNVNPSLYYSSDSKGLVRIDGMELHHLRNAVLKMYKEWVDSLYKITDTQELVRNIVNGNENKTFIAMIKEIQRRKSTF
jgi:hypothetical protein